MKKTLLAFVLLLTSLLATAQSQLPISIDFEDAAQNALWSFPANTSTANAFTIGNAASNGGSSALYVSNDGGTTSGYTNTASTATYATFPVHFDAAGVYLVEYYWQGAGETGYDYGRAYVMPNTVDLSTYAMGLLATTTHNTDWIDADGTTALCGNTSWTFRSNSVEIPAAGDYMLVFAWRNDGSVGTNPAFAVDDIVIRTKSCYFENLAVSGIHAHGASSLTFATDCQTIILSATNNATGVVEIAPTTISATSARHVSTLQPDQEYTITGRGICANGDTTNPATVVFRTLCDSILVDATNHYTEDFESYSTGSGQSMGCWMRGKNPTGYTEPYVSTSSGSLCAYLYSYSSSTYNYIATPAIKGTPITGLRVYFRTNMSSTTQGIAVGVMTDPADFSTFVGVDTIRPGVTGWTTCFADLDSYTGAGKSVAFATVGNPAYIDDVEIMPIPNCREANFTAAAVVGGANITITPNSASDTQWEVIVTTGADVTETAGVVYSQIVTSPTVSVSGLPALTYYNVFVRTVCSATESSPWTNGNFTTPCTPIDMPLIENFEGTTFPANACWTRLFGKFSDVAAGTLTPTVYASGWSRNTQNYGLPANHMKINLYGTGCKYWLVTPAINIPSAAELTFDIAHTGYANGNAYTSTGTDDCIIIAVSTDNGNTWSTANVLREWNNTGSAYVLDNISNTGEAVSLDLSAYIGQTIKIAFYGESTVSDDDHDIHIDNIKVLPISSCGIPEVALTTATGSITATITPADPTDTQWDVVVTTDATNADATAVVYNQTVTNTTVTVNGLQDLTQYYVFVRTRCSESEQSFWMNATISTPCGFYHIPFAENFDAVEAGVPDCWTRLSGLIGTNVTVYTSGWNTTTYGFTTKNEKMNMYSTSKYWLVTPTIVVDSTAKLSFDLALTAYNNNSAYTQTSTDDRFLVVVSTDDGATWSETNALAIWDNQGSSRVLSTISNTGDHFELSLANYVGQNVKIAFYGESTVSGTDYDMHVDNVAVNYAPAAVNVDLTEQICAGAAYTAYGFNLTGLTAGSYTYTRTTEAGDTVYNLALTVLPTATGSENATVCASALPYAWNGQSLTAAGTYTHNLVAANGCDSIVTLTLVVNQDAAYAETAAVCASALPYVWNGQSLTAAGTYTHTTTAANGCDSVVTLTLTVSQATTETETITICNSALPYTWNGQSLTAAGTYTYNGTNAAGCDSIVTLTLVVNQEAASAETVTVCASTLPYVWNGQSLTAAGEYTHTTTAANGCDSVITLTLVVNQEAAYAETVTVCASTLPYAWNGQSLTAAGEYTYTTTAANGCDSVVTLTLVVNQESAETVDLTICDTELPYAWNGQDITAAGTYTYNTTNEAGCDSVVTLNLTVNASYAQTDSISILDTELPYMWNGQEITEAGEYTFNGTTAEGCDSIITLVLDVQVGLDYAEDGMFAITPNPVERGGNVRIDANINEASVVEVFTSNGKLISRAEFGAETIYVTMPQVAGLYMVRLTTNSGRTMYGKVIVK